MTLRDIICKLKNYLFKPVSVAVNKLAGQDNKPFFQIPVKVSISFVEKLRELVGKLSGGCIESVSLS